MKSIRQKVISFSLVVLGCLSTHVALHVLRVIYEILAEFNFLRPFPRVFHLLELEGPYLLFYLLLLFLTTAGSLYVTVQSKDRSYLKLNTGIFLVTLLFSLTVIALTAATILPELNVLHEGPS